MNSLVAEGLGGEIGGYGTIFQITPDGVLTTLYRFANGSDGYNPTELIQATDGNFYGNAQNVSFRLDVTTPPSDSTFFTGQVALSDGVYYLSFPSGNYFGYYSYLSDPRYIYHFDLGYEYVFDAADGKAAFISTTSRAAHFSTRARASPSRTCTTSP